ncbi:MAG: glycosyltransferase family 2 protein [Brevinematales bacterium]|nr:glycosyltransferase family 2 protein [Brevinematales bacterium]
MKEPFVAIVLVNYNSHNFLIECLESIYRLNYKSFQVIITENSEKNQEKEIEYLSNWLKEEMNIEINQKFKELFTGKIKKPGLKIIEEKDIYNKNEDTTSIILIKSKENSGFAGGCNKALDYIKSQNRFDFVWMLNTDTIVEKNSLATLIEKFNEDEKLIAVSSKLKYYDKPSKINLIGGKFSDSLLKMGYIPLGYLEEDKGQYDKDIKIDSPAMASCLIKLKYLDNVGYMKEDYFLYSEDIEWFERMKRCGYSFGYQYKSIVYHKESAITKKIKKLSLYYYIRNKIHFYLTYYKATKYKIGLFISITRDIYGNIKRGNFSNLIIIFKAISDGLKGKLGKINL